MREIMKFFGANRKRIRRIAHERHPRYFDGVSFAETFNDQLNNIMEDVMESMVKHTKHYHTDLLHDYDSMKRILEQGVEENSMFYAIAVREGGTDHIEYIETYIKSEEVDLSSKYSDIFWFFALIDVDSYTGEPVRYIDVYRLQYKE
jgi:hypothetical protein